MARVQFEIIEYEWSKKYREKGICPVCMKNPKRKQFKTCSPKCNDLFYKRCCIVHDWQSLKSKALERDNNRCVWCKSTDRLEVDHIKAINLGGDAWELDNLQTLCHECHKKKTKADVREMANIKKMKLGMYKSIKW